MHEEVNEKVISLAIKGGKISADLLKAALTKLLKEMGEIEKETEQKLKARRETVSHGKQSLKKLTQQGSQLTNIEVTDKNIKSFDRVARKYGIDYSLKKDASTEPPRYLVFFKAKDVDVMTAAFKEYTGVSMKKTKKTSIRKKLQIAKDRVAKERERTKTKEKVRRPER
ncbi:MAG: PcfB family protein [Lachnospiraceae bacterium]|nr:PcfB family protein [Lachnospiraceae bacterium]